MSSDQQIFQNLDRYLTPYKLGVPVIEPSRKEGAYDSIAIDGLFVFTHHDKIWLLHIGYDGVGYQTAFATSDNPAGPFTNARVVLKRGEGNDWDNNNIAGVWMLSEDDLFHTRKLKKYDGKYWMYYQAYPNNGYEEGCAAIGAAWCEKEDLSEWHRLPEPILTVPNTKSWDSGGLYKNCVIEHNGKFYLFYNAKNETYGFWIEQIGVCVGSNPYTFERIDSNPVLKVSRDGWDCNFSSDPWVVRDGDKWVMYYYGYNSVKACEGIAFSEDLIHWTKYPDPIIIPGKSGEIDDKFAHKPAILYQDGVLYHYYCCCRNSPGEGPFHEHRTITVAASKAFT